MYAFRVSIHARPEGLQAGPPLIVETALTPPSPKGRGIKSDPSPFGRGQGEGSSKGRGTENTFATLAVSREQFAESTFACTFEAAMAALAALPRLFIELDGSFVWVSRQTDSPWQVDGNLYDYQERLRLVDLQGTCPPEALDQLLQALGWPRTKVMFQLIEQGVFCDEAEFRRHALLAGRTL